MTDKEFKLGVLKLGCIGAAPLLDLMFDERADREDLEVRAYTSGAKLDPKSCIGVTEDLISFRPNLALIVSPNASLPGPTQARAAVAEAGIPIVSVGDAPSKKAFYKKNKEGKLVLDVPDNQGFILLPGDPMIGARREFLDSAEMLLFNADVLKVLSATGVIHSLKIEIDRVISTLKAGQVTEYPLVNISPDRAIVDAEFSNPYAAAKAFAALTIAQNVAAVTTRGCFQVDDRDQYINLVAAGHEMIRAAAMLADDAREIEKANDSVFRAPHDAHGGTLKKSRLMQKPE